MFLLTRPSPEHIRAFLESQRNRPFSYPDSGGSRIEAPGGYTVDRNRVRLGTGREVFQWGIKAVRGWKMFDIPWLSLCWPDAPIEAGATVAVVVSHFGFRSMNACRIVYVIEEENAFGFGYGTLPGHAEIGEERFTVEFHPDDRSVWYDIYAFSRPRALVRLAKPAARILQKRFAVDSKHAMRRAVERAWVSTHIGSSDG